MSGQRQTKKKIFAREQVEADTRTKGIRGSSHATNANGDLRGRSSTARGFVAPQSYDSSAATWGAISGTMSSIMSLANKMEERAYNERQKQEQRAYEDSKYHSHKAEERAYKEQQDAEKLARERESKSQQLLGNLESSKIIAAINEKKADNGYSNYNQIIPDFEQRIDELRQNGQATPELIDAIISRSVPALESIVADFQKQHKADLANTGKRVFSSSLNETLERINGVSFGDLDTVIDSAVDVFVSHGGSKDEAAELTTQLVLSNMDTLAARGDLGAVTKLKDYWDQSNRGHSAPQDAKGNTADARVEARAKALIDDYMKAAPKRKEAADKEEADRIKNNVSDFKTRLGQAQTAEDYAALEAELAHEDAGFLYGEDLYKLRKEEANDREFNLYQKRPAGNEKAYQEVMDALSTGDRSVLDRMESDHFPFLLKGQRDELLKARDGLYANWDTSDAAVIQFYMNSINDALSEPGMVSPYTNFKVYNKTTDAKGKEKFSIANGGQALFELFKRELKTINRADYGDDHVRLRNAMNNVCAGVQAKFLSGRLDEIIPINNSFPQYDNENIEKHFSYYSVSDITKTIRPGMNSQAAWDQYIDQAMPQNATQAEARMNINLIHDSGIRVRLNEEFRQRYVVPRMESERSEMMRQIEVEEFEQAREAAQAAEQAADETAVNSWQDFAEQHADSPEQAEEWHRTRF